MLIFPDGVRLATLEEIPGAESERASTWARVEAARIEPGFVLRRVEGQRFKCYVEANVDAPALWLVFRELCEALLEPEATLLFAHIDDDLHPVGHADVAAIIKALTPHQYQLTQDGWVQFGLVSDGESINEILITPTKHLKVWLADEARLRSTMAMHGVPEVAHLEFLDQFPRVTTRLPADKSVFHDYDELAMRLEYELRAKPEH